MALGRQIIEFPLDIGLDTKTDQKKLQFGALSVAENVIYETKKALRKRNGYNRILNKLFGAGNTQSLVKLAAFKQELLSFSKKTLYSYSESAEKWVEKGKVYAVYPVSSPITRRNTQQNNPYLLLVSGFKVYVYEEATGGLYYSVVDEENNSFMVSYGLASSVGNNAKLGKIGNKVYIVFNDSGILKAKTFDITLPNTLSSTFNIATDYDNATDKYDLISSANKIYVAYQSTTDLSLVSIDDTNTLSSVVSLAGESATNGLDFTADSIGRLVLTFADSSDLKFTIFSATLTASLIPVTTLETIANLRNVTSCFNGSSYEFFYEITSASDTDTVIRKTTSTPAGIIGTPIELVRSLNLSGKATFYLNSCYVPCLYSSDLQSTYFIIDQNGKIVCKYELGTAGSLQNGGGLPAPFFISDSQLEVVGQSRLGIVADEGTFYSTYGVISTVLDFNFNVLYENADMASNKHITGGVLRMYDGKNIVEHSFNVFPEELLNTATATVGGAMSDGLYGYKAIYSWIDNQGNPHRSAESLNLSVTLTGGTATQTVDIQVPTLRLTDKEDVVIEIYRTESNLAEVYYKVTNVSNPVLNDTSVDFVTFTDTLPDTAIISREPLYTSGGILSNISAPASKYITTFQNRIVLLGLENENLIQFSKINLNGLPVEFNDELQLKVKDSGGGITGGTEIDDKLIIFKQTSIFYTTGEGPNNAGEQNDFNEPELISSDIGCIDAKSIALTPKGVMFKSLKGIYLLTSGLQLVYVGDRVEAFNDLTITSVDVVGDQNQVRFITDTNLCLVYNYDLDKWATFTNHGGLSSTTILADYYYLRNDGTVFMQNKNIYSDDGSPIKFRIVSGWLYLTEIQGFQRVYKAFLLGSYKSKHNLLVKTAYNFVEAFIQEKQITIGNFINTNNYGEDSPYGLPDTVNYGGTNIYGNRYQARIDMKKQKCQAIKMSIEDVQNEDVGEGLVLSGITFEVGAKVGPYKIESDRQFGTE